MKIDRALVLQTFLAETEEHLATVEEILLRLESRGHDPEQLDALFRIAHTLKGSAATFGFHDLAAFAHAWEDSLEAVAQSRAPLTREGMNLLLDTVDTLRALVPATVTLDALKSRILQVADAGGPSATQATTSPEDAQPRARDGVARSRTLRVETQKLDRILSLTTEVAIAHGRLGEALVRRDEGTVELHHDASRLHMDLQEQVMRLRMIPLGPIFRQYARAVRDTASELGKEAVLEVHGDDVEVDVMVVDLIRDPLLHMVRNALAHGIESPQEREAKGKPREGVVRLAASHDAGMVVVKVSDDGAGLSREKILARAHLSRAEAERMTDEQVHALIFTPHFSTASSVDAVSGRGVGMDVVRKNVDALRGTIHIESVPGEGTTFTLRLPLTVAIIEGFGVGASNETYVIPMEFVEEVVELDAGHARAGQSSGVMDLRGRPLPFLRLRDFFHLPKASSERESVVVLTNGRLRIGVVVDVLLGQGQTVIKPLAKIFQGVPGISGSAILGNGRVALIIDVPGFIQAALGANASRFGAGGPGGGEGSDTAVAVSGGAEAGAGLGAGPGVGAAAGVGAGPAAPGARPEPGAARG